MKSTSLNEPGTVFVPGFFVEIPVAERLPERQRMVLCSRLGTVKLQVYWQEMQHDYRLLYLVIARSAATWQSVLLPPAGRRTPEGGAIRALACTMCALNYCMVATGNHDDFDSLRGAPLVPPF